MPVTTGQSESVSERESMGKNILQDLELRLLLQERTMLLFECPFFGLRKVMWDDPYRIYLEFLSILSLEDITELTSEF